MCCEGGGRHCANTHTFDIQHDGHVDLGFCIDLALVDAAVALLHVLDAQVVVVAVFRMSDAESPVAGVRVDAGREDVQVSLSHPRHLRTTASD